MSECGRFLQTDPVGYEDDLNLYQYVGNDPLNATDPSGMYTCSGSRAECDAIYVAVRGVSVAAEHLSEGSSARADLEGVAAYYGDYGEDNGVVVAAGRLPEGVLGTASNDGSRVTFDLEQIAVASEREGPMATGWATAAGVAGHEGRHGADRQNGIETGASRAEIRTDETRGYRTESNVYRGLGIWDESVSDRQVGDFIREGAQGSLEHRCRRVLCGD